MTLGFFNASDILHNDRYFMYEAGVNLFLMSKML